MSRPSAPPETIPAASDPLEEGSAPLFFRFEDASERGAFRELRERRSIRVHDTFLTQLDGLLKARAPERRLTQHALELERARYCQGHSPDQLGVWVYYPWRQALVHLLDEADFIELRTSRNRHKITKEEQALLQKRKLGIVGLSVGGQVAIAMATERICGELRLADFDVVELSNLNRLREGVFSLGIAKTTLIARAIAELDPFLKVVCFHDGLTQHNLDAFLTHTGSLDVLVDECDDLAMKLECRARARQLGIPVVMEANDRATLDIERFDREPNRPLLHGLLEGLDLSRVDQLKTSEEKVPYLLPMVGESTMSDKLRASLIEVGETIETWPQLASDVAVGAGLVTHVVRRILLEQLQSSGRYFVDLEELVRDEPGAHAPASHTTPTPATSVERRAPHDLPSDSRPGQLRLASDELTALVDAAILAPSGANEQPWQWLVSGPNLWLVADSPFGDSLLNFRGAATELALGAAAENLVLSAHQRQLQVLLEPPSAGARACFRFFPRTHPDLGFEGHAHDSLAAYIQERHTNRRRVSGPKIPAEVLTELTHMVRSSPECELYLASDGPALAELADILGRAERIRMLHPTGHRDLVSEIRWTKQEAERTRDGIDLATIDLSPAESAGLSMLRSPGVPALLRRWKGGRGLEKLTRQALLQSSAIGLISVPSYGVGDLFRAGRALERAWLFATQKELALQPHTAALFLFARAFGGGAAAFDPATLGELYSLQARLRAVFGASGSEVFLFRLFPGCTPLARSLRRRTQPVIV